MAEMAHIFEEERWEESPIHAQNETAENNDAIDLHDDVASDNGNGHDTVMVIDEDGDYGGVMEEEANEEVGSNSDNGKAVERRPRSHFRWTKQMHHYFVSIVDKIGGPEKATPKSILQMMNVKDLNIGQLKYHLQMYRGKKLDKDGKVLPPRNRQLQNNDSHMDKFYPRTGSQSLYGFENRGLLGSNSFLEHDCLFQHPISHQLNPHSGDLWQQDLAFNQYPVPGPVWRNQAPANDLFYDMFSRNKVMPPQPLLQSSNIYNIGDAVMGNGIVTHHQLLMENWSPPSETIENQRKDNVIWTNSEWIGSNSTPQLQPNLINFFEPTGWNNNQQFCPSSNDLNIINNPPDPQLEPQEVNTFIGFQKNENPQLKKYKDEGNLYLSLSLPLGDNENAEKVHEYAKEFSGELSLSLGSPSMKPQPQPSEEPEEITESERTVTDNQLLETNIRDDAATEELIKDSDPTSSIPAVE